MTVGTTTWDVGSVRIHLIAETEFTFPVAGLLRTDDTALPDRYPWLAPHFTAPGGMCQLAVHGLVVDTGRRRVLVDTCIGNDRADVPPAFRHSGTPWLERLATAGYPPASIDTVVCTHLHFDHIGWNTTLVHGTWTPTFPNARYLIPRAEWEFWTAGEESPGSALADTVRPLVDAGLADFVTADHRVCDEVRLEPTPGHTPGHVAVVIESGGESDGEPGDESGTERAVITGDLAHHPLQFAIPALAGAGDHDPDLAAATRRRFVARYAGTGTLVIGSHFPPPTAGYLAHGDGGVRFET